MKSLVGVTFIVESEKELDDQQIRDAFESLLVDEGMRVFNDCTVSSVHAASVKKNDR